MPRERLELFVSVSRAMRIMACEENGKTDNHNVR
jgi:hypothetical protein